MHTKNVNNDAKSMVKTGSYKHERNEISFFLNVKSLFCFSHFLALIILTTVNMKVHKQITPMLPKNCIRTETVNVASTRRTNLKHSFYISNNFAEHYNKPDLLYKNN